MIDLLMLDLTVRPISTLIVVCMALGVNVLFSGGRRLLTDVTRAKRWRTEIKEHQTQMRKAMLEKDKTKTEKMKKKDKKIKEMQMKMSMESLKVSFLFFIPLMLLWWLISGLLGPDAIVAMSPIQLPLIVFTVGPDLNFWWFYIISSFALSGIITKLFGVGLD